MKKDSMEKVCGYLEASSQPILVVSRLFFRGFTCPPGCGGCCPSFSLDYKADSERWKRFKEMYPEKVEDFKARYVNGVKFYTYWNDDHSDDRCKYMDRSNGRCTVHKANPFSCDFELNKFHNPDLHSKATLICRLFSRGWNMKRVDGGRGALCEMTSFDYEKFRNDVKLLNELDEWGRDMGYRTKLPQVIEFFEDNDDKFKKGLVPKYDLEFR